MLLTSLLGTALAGPTCSPVPPENYVLAIGYGTGAPALALREAREDARARLLAQVCAGLADARCAGIARHVRDWEAGEPSDGAVCASAAVRRDQISSLERGHAQLSRDASALAAAVAERVGPAPVALAPARWTAHGCTAGATAASLDARLRNELAGRARLVSEAEHTVQLGLADGGDTLDVTATLGQVQLPGFAVALDVLGLGPLPSSPCKAAGARPVPARGTVTVDGTEREETHWIGACGGDELDGVRMAAQSLSDADQRAQVTAMVETYRGEVTSLCRRYERFEIDSDTYARRTEELAKWAREAQERVLSGQALGTPGAVEALALEVHALRSSGTPLRSGDVVHHRDTFELRARPSADSYLYVVYENSAGDWAVIPETGSATFVPGASWAELPRQGFEFVVDDQAGRSEVVYVLATPEAVDLSALTPTAITTRFKARGLGVQAKTVTQPSGSTFYGDPEQVVKGYGGVLYTLVLDHR